jgi:hypothetical protein
LQMFWHCTIQSSNTTYLFAVQLPKFLKFHKTFSSLLFSFTSRQGVANQDSYISSMLSFT